jgi:hypothetical protein
VEPAVGWVERPEYYQRMAVPRPSASTDQRNAETMPNKAPWMAGRRPLGSVCRKVDIMIRSFEIKHHQAWLSLVFCRLDDLFAD